MPAVVLRLRGRGVTLPPAVKPARDNIDAASPVSAGSSVWPRLRGGAGASFLGGQPILRRFPSALLQGEAGVRNTNEPAARGRCGGPSVAGSGRAVAPGTAACGRARLRRDGLPMVKVGPRGEEAYRSCMIRALRLRHDRRRQRSTTGRATEMPGPVARSTYTPAVNPLSVTSRASPAPSASLSSVATRRPSRS